jgi:hypothetical protein
MHSGKQRQTPGYQFQVHLAGNTFAFQLIMYQELINLFALRLQTALKARSGDWFDSEHERWLRNLEIEVVSR